MVFCRFGEYLVIKTFFFFPVFIKSVCNVLNKHLILLLTYFNTLTILIFIFGFLSKSQLGCPIATASWAFLLFRCRLFCKNNCILTQYSGWTNFFTLLIFLPFYFTIFSFFNNFFIAHYHSLNYFTSFWILLKMLLLVLILFSQIYLIL